MLPSRCDTDTIVIANQGMTNSATVTGSVDTNGADYATIRISLASEINTNAIGPTISVLQSDTTDSTNFATLVADEAAVDITAAASLHYGVDMRGKKRYLKVSITTETTTNDNCEVSALATLSRKSSGPSGTTGIADVVHFL